MSECQQFPDTWEEFEQLYGFTDKEEVYTNGSRLIQSFRVKQWLDHTTEPKRKKGKWIDDGTELGCCCSECGVTLDDYFYGALYEVRLSKMPNFCPNCGARMEWE